MGDSDSLEWCGSLYFDLWLVRNLPRRVIKDLGKHDMT